MKLYMHLNGENFEKLKKEANKKSKEDIADSKDYNFGDLNLEVDKIGFENGTITASGSNELGYFSVDFDLDLDIVVDIIEFYMKKLGKLKTVLEATK